jgi:Fic family protein
LTRRETAVVVEKGLTVSGKSLVEHLEATNHATARRRIMELVLRKPSELSESTVLERHNTILRGIDDRNAECKRMVSRADRAT